MLKRRRLRPTRHVTGCAILRNWANPHDLKVVTYAEGDLIKTTAETKAGFIELIREIAAMDDFRGIDPGLREPIAQRFKELGLGDLLH